MLHQPLYSLFIRMIPEAFLIMHSICLLTASHKDLKKISTAAVLGGIGVYIVRLMPIHFGVHTILAVMIDILLVVKILDINIQKAISGTLISIIIIFMSDIILFAIYTNVFHFSSEVIAGQTIVSVISGIPSLIIFYFIIRAVVYVKEKRS